MNPASWLPLAEGTSSRNLSFAFSCISVDFMLCSSPQTTTLVALSHARKSQDQIACDSPNLVESDTLVRLSLLQELLCLVTEYRIMVFTWLHKEKHSDPNIKFISELICIRILVTFGSLDLF